MRDRQHVLEELLVLRAQAGELRAMDQLVRLYHSRLLRLATRMAGPGDAEEVVQEAWVGLLSGLRRLRDPTRFRAWAFAIVANKCRDATRRLGKSRLRERVLHPEEQVPATIPGQVPREEISDLRKAIRDLPSGHRTVLELFYLEGLETREIGTALGIPAGTVKSRLFEVRRRLRAALASDDEHRPRRSCNHDRHR